MAVPVIAFLFLLLARNLFFTLAVGSQGWWGSSLMG